MNRELKFRVWDVEHNSFEMVSLHLVPLNENGKWLKISALDPSPDRYIISQFTGLKDSEDNEIFEGDIVKLDELIIDVKFINDKRCCYVRPFTSASLSCKKFNVIGNIYQNPELLEN